MTTSADLIARRGAATAAIEQAQLALAAAKRQEHDALDAGDATAVAKLLAKIAIAERAVERAMLDREQLETDIATARQAEQRAEYMAQLAARDDALREDLELAGEEAQLLLAAHRVRLRRSAVLATGYQAQTRAAHLAAELGAAKPVELIHGLEPSASRTCQCLADSMESAPENERAAIARLIYTLSPTFESRQDAEYRRELARQALESEREWARREREQELDMARPKVQRVSLRRENVGAPTNAE